MDTERIEEAILLIVAVLMLLYIFPFTIAADMAITVALALLLIAILVLRSIAWHKDGITPYDGITVIGIALTFIYLASLTVLATNALNTLVLLLFACFFSLMAVVLYQHRKAPEHPRVRKLRVWKVGPKTPRSEFKKGVEPIPERPPRWYRRVFTRKARSANVEPLAERPPRWYNRTLPQGAAHAPRRTGFKSGMEPIPEITPEHLHRMGVYDAAPKRK